MRCEARQKPKGICTLMQQEQRRHFCTHTHTKANILGRICGLLLLLLRLLLLASIISFLLLFFSFFLRWQLAAKCMLAFIYLCFFVLTVLFLVRSFLKHISEDVHSTSRKHLLKCRQRCVCVIYINRWLLQLMQ